MIIHIFFTSKIFTSRTSLKLAKNRANAKQHPEPGLENYLEIIHILNLLYSRK